MAGTEVLEQGDIFFFYRPRVETREVEDRDNVQRFFMLLAVGDGDAATRFRLFVVGRKQLPEIRPEEMHPEERNWAKNVLTTSDVERIRHELMARDYPTATRGIRHVGGAKPVGEGRYQLVSHRGHSELAYALELPQQPGVAQAEFEIKDTASYVIAIKNPEIQIPGFPGVEEGPRFPRSLRSKFGDRRWIAVDDPAMLDYEGVEIVLIGAHVHDVEEELGVELDEQPETADSAAVLRTPIERPAGARAHGKATRSRAHRTARRAGTAPRTARARWHCALCDEAFDQRSRYERHMLAAHPPPAPSAADVEHALGAIDFPKTRRALVAHAARRLGPESAIVRLIRALPARRYRDAADVAIALGESKRPRRGATWARRRHRRAA